jgi:hypothetical protein
MSVDGRTFLFAFFVLMKSCVFDLQRTIQRGHFLKTYFYILDC